jgi:hypothetical protein
MGVLVALKRAGNDATNTATLLTVRGLAGTLLKFWSLLKSLWYLVDGDFATGDGKGVAGQYTCRNGLKLRCRIPFVKNPKLTE